jgi:hypothetical protein
MPALYGILISKDTYIVCKWFSEGGGARIVCNKHQRTKSVYTMLSRLEWRTLENTLSNDIVAINKTDRLVPPKRITRNTHSRSYQIASTSSDYPKGSFSPSTIRERNALSLDIVEAKTPEVF